MGYEQYTLEEIARIGEEIYQTRIRHQVEAQHRDQFLVLDIETGAYEIADKDAVASDLLLARVPDAVLYGVRIGHSAAYSFFGFAGGSPR